MVSALGEGMTTLVMSATAVALLVVVVVVVTFGLIRLFLPLFLGKWPLGPRRRDRQVTVFRLHTTTAMSRKT